MVYDSKNQVMILTCGNNTNYGAGYNAGTWLHDTWILDVEANTWTEMKPALQPVCGEKAWQPAYDPVNNLTVVVDENSSTWVYRYKNGVKRTEPEKTRRPDSK